jgi:hypothetical protein
LKGGVVVVVVMMDGMAINGPSLGRKLRGIITPSIHDPQCSFDRPFKKNT